MLSTSDQMSRIEARKRKLAEDIERLEQELDKLNAAIDVIRMLEMEDRNEANFGHRKRRPKGRY